MKQLFLIGEILPKSEMRNEKYEIEVILEGFHHQKWGKKKGKNCLFLIVCFECVAININGGLKILYSCLVYSQIWLNLFKDDHQVFYIVLCMIATWATTVLWYFTSLTSAKMWGWCHGPWGRLFFFVIGICKIFIIF